MKKSQQKSILDLSKQKQGILSAIVGPTATGKSSLAMDLAEMLDAEIVCADSITAYKHVSIGAAKPSLADQQRVPHHLLDICEPSHRLTVVEFVQKAEEALFSIWERGKGAIVVGGSGLYIDALLYGYQFEDLKGESHTNTILEFESMSLEELQEQASKLYPNRLNQSDRHNRRRLIQLLMRGIPNTSDRYKRAYDCTIIGLDKPDDVLKTSIESRTTHMIEAGFVDEVRSLVTQYGNDVPCLQSVGYRQVRDYVCDDLKLDQLVTEINRATWQLVRKQRTWFRRAHDIEWISDGAESVTVLRKNGYNI